MSGRSALRTFVVLSLLAASCLAFCPATALAWADDQYGIFVIKADGSEVRKVVQVDGYEYHAAPRWSHDGQRLAFDVRSGAEYKEKQIYLVNVDGSGLREFARQVNCDWSPDDKQIVLSVYDSEGEQAGIYVQNVDGGGREFLTQGASPRWSADGSKIAFTDWRTLKFIDVATGEIGEMLNVELDQYPFHFDWSRDGRFLAMVARQKGSRRALYILDTENLDRELKPRWRTDKYFPGFVSWSPDGKQLAVNADHTIQILDVEGTRGAKRLPGQTARGYEPHWSPDGKWLAFARRPTWEP